MPAYIHRIFSTSILAFFVIALLFGACRKHEAISTDPSLKLHFSADSVIFDTVFSSLGSVTLPLLVYNKNNERLSISSIFLESGGQSAYRVNVDGIPALSVSDIEIAPNDSLFIFVRVTIDPRDLSNPFVVEDELVFITNGNEQKVRLVAWGQDAIYIVADTELNKNLRYKIVAGTNETIIWTSAKPYVVYGYAAIDSLGTLIIEEGTKVHFHDKSGLWAYIDGTLKVRGSFENPVVFQGSRLEQRYRNVPGQWDRIWLMEGRQGSNHEIEYAIIRNGFIGIQAESFRNATQNKLQIKNTIIENKTGMGIFSVLFNIEAENLVVANTGSHSMALTAGGYYDFKHTTIANYWAFSVRNSASLLLNNYFIDPQNNTIAVPMHFGIGNSIVHGSNLEEIVFDFSDEAEVNYLFDHVNLRTQRKLEDDDAFISCTNTEAPRFRDYAGFDYRPDSLSPVIDKGSPIIAAQVPIDLDGIQRTESPDLGAYQFVPYEEEPKDK